MEVQYSTRGSTEGKDRFRLERFAKEGEGEGKAEGRGRLTEGREEIDAPVAEEALMQRCRSAASLSQNPAGPSVACVPVAMF